MDIQTALWNLGVREDTLTPDEQRSLDEHGFVILRQMMAPAQIRAFIARLEDLARAEGGEAGKEAHQEEGTIRLGDLINKDPMFEFCFTHPRLLAAANRVLVSGFKVDSLNARFALPGLGHQALHADWGSSDPAEWDRVKAGHFFGMNSLWLLDDFTAENGATRIVPGTHRSYRVPADDMADTHDPHPDEVLPLEPAGTVIAFNSHCWHGGTLNRTQGLRRVMHMAFVPRDRKSLTDQRRYLRPETARRLTPEMLYLLDA